MEQWKITHISILSEIEGEKLHKGRGLEEKFHPIH